MMIKLTNATVEHLGNPIWINVYQITAVFPQVSPEGGSQSTIVFGGQTGVTWFVEEGVEEVVKMINKAKDRGI